MKITPKMKKSAAALLGLSMLASPMSFPAAAAPNIKDARQHYDYDFRILVFPTKLNSPVLRYKPKNHASITARMNAVWNDRIRFIAGPYTAGPYSDGVYDISFPITAEVMAAIKPEYVSSFMLYQAK